jgi:glycosyltransferase involved in cell wall biosynthesis
MTIHFIHPHKAFLPEIIAYTDFFSAHGIITSVIGPADRHTADCDVAWHFMGHHTSRDKHTLTIHEYASASIPPFSKLKDLVKKWINTRPDFRIYNNDYVLQQFSFNDGIPFGIRNYGIPSGTAHLLPGVEKLYDFVYVGTVDKGRRTNLLLDLFSGGPLQAHRLLVLSRNYQELGTAYAGCSNIFFKGPIPYHEVFAHIQQARYGINFMPDRIPYNRQTAAKLIDYAACGLPVITTDYAWVRNFQQQFGGAYFFLEPDLSNFTWENVTNYVYKQPDLTNWTWERQIRTSGVLEFLQVRFPQVKF